VHFLHILHNGTSRAFGIKRDGTITKENSMGSVYARCDWCGSVLVDDDTTRNLPMKPSFDVGGGMEDVLYEKRSLACLACFQRINEMLRRCAKGEYRKGAGRRSDDYEDHPF
jgi:hypothetical protein